MSEKIRTSLDEINSADTAREVLTRYLRLRTNHLDVDRSLVNLQGLVASRLLALGEEERAFQFANLADRGLQVVVEHETAEHNERILKTLGEEFPRRMAQLSQLLDDLEKAGGRIGDASRKMHDDAKSLENTRENLSASARSFDATYQGLNNLINPSYGSTPLTHLAQQIDRLLEALPARRTW